MRATSSTSATQNKEKGFETPFIKTTRGKKSPTYAKGFQSHSPYSHGQK